MYKKSLLIFALLIAIFLSGCSISFTDKKTTPVVKQEEKKSDNVQTSPEIISSSTASVPVIAVATSSLENTIDINSDNDGDGLYDIQELGYGTKANNPDSDGDGFTDLNEINGGYNPNGSGKIIPEKCLIIPNTDDCYLKTGIANKDKSLCQKISTENNKLLCILKVGLINREEDICKTVGGLDREDPDFFNRCMRDIFSQLKSIANFNQDARTVSDIKQIQTGLELYYNDAGKYPTGSIFTEGKITYNGTDYITQLPRGTKGKTEACSKDYQYVYTRLSDTEYTLTYCLDKDVTGIKAGIHTASPKGIY